jgi:hypothetical protein
MPEARLYGLLLRDYSTSDAIASIPAGIGLHVVRLGVNDQRGTTIAKCRVAACS